MNGESLSSESILIEEITCILKRNQTEKFLRSLLTRALILEELTNPEYRLEEKNV